MALNVPGLVIVIILYAVIVTVGILAARFVRPSGDATPTETSMVAGRNLNLVVGIFTMTGRSYNDRYVVQVNIGSQCMLCMGKYGHCHDRSMVVIEEVGVSLFGFREGLKYTKSIETDSQIFLNFLYEIRNILPEINITLPCSFPPGV